MYKLPLWLRIWNIFAETVHITLTYLLLLACIILIIITLLSKK